MSLSKLAHGAIGLTAAAGAALAAGQTWPLGLGWKAPLALASRGEAAAPAASSSIFGLLPSGAFGAASFAGGQRTVLAYARAEDGRVGRGLLSAAPAAPTDANPFGSALSAYAAGNLAAGDALAAEIGDPVARTALEWAALHAPANIGFYRFTDFLSAHPSWPAADWVRRAAEAALWRDKSGRQQTVNFFARRGPETAMGALALARAELAGGDEGKASDLARRVWRDDDLFPALETALRSEFGKFLTADDDRRRAERLLYRGEIGAGLRAAAHGGADPLALARVMAAAIQGRASPAVMRSAPASLRDDPAFLYAQILRMRSLDKVADAAQLMLRAPHDAAALIDPEAWWIQRRWLARKLLDLGQARLAYRLCDEAVAGGGQARLDAEFHSGWIALRYLADPKAAQAHFTRLLADATMPISKARALYWLGRTQAALGDRHAAQGSYQAAAVYSTTYYGQLARAEIGAPSAPSSSAAAPAAAPEPADRDRSEPIRVVELLDASGRRELALSLAVKTAHALDDPAQLQALAGVGRELGDAHETLAVGKIAERRGFDLKKAAFPTFGIPKYAQFAGSAPAEIVYAVARQESAFRADALSSAGAKGIMQMIVPTAKRTAERFKIPFDAKRLSADAAYNAELGAAHLGLLLREQRGSLILTFAAYNAGGGRVKEWIAAHGDPRRPGVDPVDWVERIPIAETRDYVQRVMENYRVYKVRFADEKARPAAPASAPTAAPTAALPNAPRPAPLVEPPVIASQARS